jgi:hypothetical protein
MHKRLRDVASAVFPKAPVGVRQGFFGNCLHSAMFR